jgi:hypothetical protein
MPEVLNELDVVALVSPVPEHGLPVGQTGTIVYVHRGGEAYEVEFPLEPRRSVVTTVKPDQIIKLKGLSAAPAV